MTDYRGVIVRSDFRLTSQNPGEGWSATMAGVRKAVSAMEPDFHQPAIVARISAHLHCSSAEASAIFTDAQRFLWMSAQTADARVPAPLIDEGWHQFLLFTKEYAEFCDTYCGGFIHHEPYTGPNGPVDEVLLHPTVDHMHALFGGKPSTNWDYVPTKEWALDRRQTDPIAV